MNKRTRNSATRLIDILAQNIKAKRKSMKISQAKLAELVGSATTYIAMIEEAKRSPSIEMIERIAEALKVDPPELFSKSTCQVLFAERFYKSLIHGVEETFKTHIQSFKQDLQTEYPRIQVA